MFNYSIVIRTLGNTGEKYLQMLQAIEQQTVKPCEIVVVVPEDHEPDHQLGIERIIHSAKGMVTQRAVGIAEAVGDYLLVLDDDLDFPNNFAEQLYNHLQALQLDCVLAFGNGVSTTDGETPTIAPLSKRILQRMKKIRLAFTGQAFYSHRKSQWFDAIVSTGGHRTFIHCEDGLCQTGCFQCFFIKAGKAKNIHFEDEKWLEQGSISSYAAYDDAVFFNYIYREAVLDTRITLTIFTLMPLQDDPQKEN